MKQLTAFLETPAFQGSTNGFIEKRRGCVAPLSSRRVTGAVLILLQGELAVLNEWEELHSACDAPNTHSDKPAKTKAGWMREPSERGALLEHDLARQKNASGFRHPDKDLTTFTLRCIFQDRRQNNGKGTIRHMPTCIKHAHILVMCNPSSRAAARGIHTRQKHYNGDRDGINISL